MSLIEDALVNLIKADADLKGVISTRFYPVIMPQNTSFPAMTYLRISGVRQQSHGGASGLAFARFQFDAWAKRYDDARDASEKLRLIIEGYSGTVLGVVINGILMLNERDGYENDTELYRVSTDYLVQHNEAKPT